MAGLPYCGSSNCQRHQVLRGIYSVFVYFDWLAIKYLLCGTVLDKKQVCACTKKKKKAQKSLLAIHSNNCTFSPISRPNLQTESAELVVLFILRIWHTLYLAGMFPSVKMSPRRSKQVLLPVKLGFYTGLPVQEMTKPGGVLERWVGGDHSGWTEHPDRHRTLGRFTVLVFTEKRTNLRLPEVDSHLL